VTTQVSWYQKGDTYNKVVLITILIIKKATLSNSQNVKDSSHANKYLKKNKKIKINLGFKVKICILAYSNADPVCYLATPFAKLLIEVKN